MTVKQLKEYLTNIPEDTEVIFRNDSSYLDGEYKATGIEYWEDDNEVVEIVTDYEWRRDDDTDGWSDGHEQ